MILDFTDLKNSDVRLSIEDILSKVDQKVIFEYYLGHNIDYKSYICSPFRKDKNPSFQFFKDKGKLWGKDWGTGELYDCFNFVQKKYNLTFPECLKVISNDFNLNKQNARHNIFSTFHNSNDDNVSSNICEIENNRKKTKITIQKQPFTNRDIIYWKQYGISIRELVKYDVFSCKYVYLNDKLIKYYSNDNPIYAYKFKDFDHISYKIYCPLSDKKYKWLFSGTSEDIEGFDQLPWLGELLIITKSLKDVICLDLLGFNAISLQGEQNKLSNEFFNKLQKRFKDIIIFYDNDETGILCSDRLSKRYDLQQVFIPKELECKDISEVIVKYGLEYAKDLINSII